MLVYLAAPIDADNAGEVNSMRDWTKARLVECGVAVFDPVAPYGGPAADPEAVREINNRALATADGVFALLPPGVSSIGVPMEILDAWTARKPVAVVGAEHSMQLAAMSNGRLRRWPWSGSPSEGVEWLVERMRREQNHPLRIVSRVADSLSLGDQFRDADALVDGPDDPGEAWKDDDGPVELEVRPLKYTTDELETDLAPVRAYPGDAGFDLVTAEETRIPAGAFKDVPCGINVELPDGVWAMVTGRSSTLRNRRLLVAQGIIDNGYRGPLFAGVQNLSDHVVVVPRGDRIAQLIPFPLVAAELEPVRVTRLSDSDRGNSGFGSTG